MDLAHRQTEEILKKLEKKIKREYSKAYKEIKKKADKYFLSFQKQDKEMISKLAAGIITHKQYLDWRTTHMVIGKRWDVLRDSIAEDLVKTNVIANQLINNEAIDIYALNYNFGAYEIESGYMINTSFALVDRTTMERLLSENPEIIPRAGDDIPKELRWNRQKITSAITQGIMQGDSMQDIAERLKTVTSMDQKTAIRNARTYTTAAENGGRVDRYKEAEEMGIELEQEWVATLDMRTRTSHRYLDGERVKVGAKFSNGCRYPADPEGAPHEIYNCRCTLVAALKGYEYQDDRFSRLPAGMTYDEWRKAKAMTKKQIEREKRKANASTD